MGWSQLPSVKIIIDNDNVYNKREESEKVSLFVEERTSCWPFTLRFNHFERKKSVWIKQIKSLWILVKWPKMYRKCAENGTWMKKKKTTSTKSSMQRSLIWPVGKLFISLFRFFWEIVCILSKAFINTRITALTRAKEHYRNV